MVISTKELMIKYSDYKVPKMKIKTEIQKGKYFLIKRGLYETNNKVDGKLLSTYIKSPSYLSFEYALSLYGLIPERVFAYTSAITGEKHNYEYDNQFGRFTYQNVPSRVFSLDVNYRLIDGYPCIIANKEKALCDLLYIKSPVSSKKEFVSFLFDDLRIDEEELLDCDLHKMIRICDVYQGTNHRYLKSFLEDVLSGRHYH